MEKLLYGEFWEETDIIAVGVCPANLYPQKAFGNLRSGSKGMSQYNERLLSFSVENNG